MTDSKTNDGTATDRRAFLKLAAASGPALAVSVAGGTAAATETRTGLMQNTAHTQQYLDSARF